MSASRRIIVTEWRLLLRSRVAGALVVLLGVSGVYGIVAGHAQMRAQCATIAVLQAQEAARLERVARTLAPGTYALGLDGDAARLVADPPSPLASLAVGQRDVLPFYRLVSGRSLAYDGAGTSYDGLTDEITNPERLVVGNFDLAFVLIVLCPLAVIALGHDVLSGEREDGTFGLWATSGSPPTRIVALKLGVRAALPTLIAAALLVGGAAWVGAGRDDVAAVAWLVIVAGLYLAWWVAVTAIVIARDRSSATNALVLFAIYLLVTVVGPSAAQLGLDAIAPVTSQADMAMRLRDRSDGLWGEIDAAAWDHFHAAHPDVPPDRERNLEPVLGDALGYGKKIVVWHYLMDVAAAPALAQYVDGLAWREATARRVHPLLPAVLASDLLTSVARTDVSAHLAFQRAVRAFQADNARRLRQLMFPGTVLTGEDLPLYPAYAPPRAPSWLHRSGRTFGLVSLAALVLGCGALAAWRLRRTFRPC